MREIADQVFIETNYQGVNVGAIRTRKGLICIDAPSYPRDARHWIASLRQIDPKPIRFLILTNAHGDRILNTSWFNTRIIAHEKTAQKLKGFEKRYPQNILDSLILRESSLGKELSNTPVEKVSISFDTNMTLIPSGLEIQLTHYPGSNLGNIGVFIPKSNVLFSGDTIVVDYPIFLHDKYSQPWLNSLQKLKTAFQEVKIVPGRGDCTSVEYVQTIIDCLQDMRRAVANVVHKGEPKQYVHRLTTDFVVRFSLNSLPREWVQTQVKATLENIYDEIQVEHQEGNLQ